MVAFGQKENDMKRIIDGASYDTDKAEKLGDDAYSYRGDFYFWSEGLYRSKSGRYFLYGEGGPMSRYSVSTGQNQWAGGEKIIPLDRKTAVAWSEEHLSGEEYAAIWGEPDEGWENINIRLSTATLNKLRASAEENKTTMTAIITKWIVDM
jgi:hypothetical protein